MRQVGAEAFPNNYREALQAGEPSTILSLLARGSELPGREELEPALAHAGLTVEALSDLEPSDDQPWVTEFEVSAPRGSEGEVAELVGRVTLERTRPELLVDQIAWRHVQEEDMRRARESEWSLSVSLFLGSEPLVSYHQQLRLVDALSPTPVLAFDADAATPRPSSWLEQVARAHTPPSPSNLFTIHAVSGGGDGAVWLHTHGLRRCGSLELDMLGVPERGASLCGELLNRVAALFIEQGVPEPDEPFLAGQDLELVWLPWEQAVEYVSAETLGGPSDRRDEVHTGARAVLFAPKKALLGRRRYRSVSCYLPLLEDNPVLYVSHMETMRMTLLASERLPRFLELLGAYGGNEDWLFLVKLGYEVDAGATGEREHLWFRVHSQQGGQVDATLLNQPYGIARMREGARSAHSLDRLTDWSVMCPHGRFDADSIGALLRVLGQARELS